MRTSASTLAETLRRRLTGAALPLLATALLLALPTVAAAQLPPKVLVFTLSESPLTVTEVAPGATTTTYEVRLSTEPTGTVTVTVASADTDVALVDTDTTADDNQDTLTFETDDWFTEQTVTVTAVDDDVDNAGDERVVEITNTPSGGGFRVAKSIEVTVYDEDVAGLAFTDDEPSPTAVEPGALAATVAEGGTGQTDTYTVVLTSKPTEDVIVDVTSGDTSAATVSPAVLTFSPMNWTVAQTVTVTGVDDNVDNAADRSVTINHLPTGGGYGAEEAATVMVDVEDTGQTQTPHDDTRGLVYSPNEPVVIEGQQATYTVKLMSKPTGTVTVELNRNITDHIRIDPQFLTFTTTTWNTPQTVRLIGSSDEVDTEANDAPFADITRKTTITHQPSGGGYTGLTTGLTVMVGLQDDDTAGLALSTKALTLVDEGNTATYTVALRSQPAANDPVTVTLTVTGATDAASVAPGTLTFTNADWSTGKTVTVTAQHDDIDQVGSNRVAPITNLASGPTRYGAVSETVTVTVNDNDIAGAVLSKSRLTIDEGPSGAPTATGTYTVVLTSEPTSGGVTVNVTSTDTSAATVQNVSFTTDDWDEPKTVTVTGVEDTIDNSGGRRLATIENRFTGGGYERVAQKNVAVTVNDNDGTAGILISRSSASLRESAPSQEIPYTVRLREDPGTPVSVTVTVSDGVVQVDPASLNFDSDDYDERKTITISLTSTGADDVDNGGNRSARISHTAPGIPGALMTVTVIDDDVARLLVKPLEPEAVTEGDEVRYEVKLNSGPDTGVNVRVVSTDPAIASVPNALTDTGLDFNAVTDAHTITVTAERDDIDNPGTSRSVDITFTPAAPATTDLPWRREHGSRSGTTTLRHWSSRQPKCRSTRMAELSLTWWSLRPSQRERCMLPSAAAT